MNLGREWGGKILNIIKGNALNRNANYIRRWPINPKIAVFGPPNTFVDEISMR